MSTPTLDIEYLEDTLLDASVPCQVLKYDPFEQVYKYCGEPSVARVKFVCDSHGVMPMRFLCMQCLINLKSGDIVCSYCDKEHTISPLTYAGES
jgi:hypothetical protein